MEEFVNENAASLAPRAASLFQQRQQEIYRQTDRMFGVLMILQWLAGIAAALWMSPYTWAGQTSSIHIHVWSAIFLGGAVSLAPVFLAWKYPGRVITRYAIAVGQMLMSSLLIHISGGRLETHFHIFGSLAFLSFYRDWKVLVPAAIVTIVDHFFRGIFYPQSIFGVLSAGQWRWIEHSGWVIFESIFLVIACLRANREMRRNAYDTAALEFGKKDYKFLSDSVLQHIWKINAEGKFYYINRQALNYFGLQLSENKYEIKLENLLHPEDYLKSVSIWRQGIEGKRQIEIPLRLRRSDGEYRWHLIQSTPIFGENERFIEFFGTSTDIHDQRQAEQAAAKSREYFNLFKHANDAIIIFDAQNKTILDVNDCACEQYDYSRQQFIGLSLADLSQNSERDSKHLAQMIESEAYYSFETVQLRRDRTPINVVVNSSIIEFDRRKAILSINRDVTAKTLADNALRQSEYKLRTLVENMNEGLLETDCDDIIIYANTRFCEMIGYASDELVGQPAAQLFLDEEGREIIRQANNRRYKKGLIDTYELKITRKDGQPLWVLVGGVPLTNIEGEITGSIGVHTDITERKLSEELFRFNSLHDALTGLPNRALLLEHLRKALLGEKRKNQTVFAVLFLDFDRFKIINDSLGHMEGDNLLIMIARRLESAIRDEDIVARLGGDEFTVMIDNVGGIDEVLTVVERIQKSFEFPFALSEGEVFMSASIGIALSDTQYVTPEEVLRDADIAMYKAKAGGRARYEIFNAAMHEQANYRLSLETEMRTALEKKEFQVFYQPIVELKSSRITGFEALIRWMHPLRGIISPTDFIPLAEENGLIVPIGEWVLNESCRQLSEWRNGNSLYEELAISVNLSLRQFDKPDLVERIAAILKLNDLPPHLLRLEITESHLMENADKTAEVMHRLRELGVKISIDDFGTGYSSLSYLHQLPVNYLKIDRSFVSRMQNNREKNEIVRTVLLLAENLGFQVIAEGVETIQQAEQLEMLNCDFAQGFLYSKPVSAAEALKLLTENSIFGQLLENIPLTAKGLVG